MKSISTKRKTKAGVKVWRRGSEGGGKWAIEKG
jgi:hypothetical protein